MKSHPWIMQVRQMCMIKNCERLVLDAFVIKCAKSLFFGSKVDNLTLLIVNFFMTQRDLKEKEFVSRPIYFNVDGFNTFQWP
jgi:hypothetical protein